MQLQSCLKAKQQSSVVPSSVTLLFDTSENINNHQFYRHDSPSLIMQITATHNALCTFVPPPFSSYHKCNVTLALARFSGSVFSECERVDRNGEKKTPQHKQRKTVIQHKAIQKFLCMKNYTYWHFSLLFIPME